MAPAEIVVVDNEARPGDLAAAVVGMPLVQTITNATNMGFAHACNQGWHATTAPYVLFLNPDVTVQPDTVERCIRELDDEQRIGIVTPRLVRQDGALDHACHRGLPTPSAGLAYTLRLDRVWPRSRTLGRYRMTWEDTTTDHDVEACCGAFMLMRRAFLEACGGWDERYWFYAEDLDLCVRASERGLRIRYLGTMTATHVKGASSKLRASTRGMSDEELTRRRRLQAAILQSHRLFYQVHLASSSSRLTRALVGAMFRAQEARLRAATRLDRHRRHRPT